jgi:hypothetical protein
MNVTDPEIIQKLEESPCYGIAHDPKVKECRMCDLQTECAALTKTNSVFDEMKKLSPDTEKAMKKTNKKKETTSKVVDINKNKSKAENSNLEKMPNTKKMSVDELWEKVKERGGTCKEYSNPKIQKMRLIMALKETYK